MARFKMALDKLAHSYAETILGVRALEPSGLLGFTIMATGCTASTILMTVR